MKTCKDCIAQTADKHGNKYCKHTDNYAFDDDELCLVGKLIRAVHIQRDRAIKAEKQFNDAAGLLAVHDWFGPVDQPPTEFMTYYTIGKDTITTVTTTTDVDIKELK